MVTIDFDKASYDDLDQHAMEKLVFDTSELSPILKGHIFIERVLDTLIYRSLRHPKSLLKKNRLTFELKVDLARSMGLISQKNVSAFKALNNIRNKYAHRDSYKVSFDELTGLKFDWVPIQDKAYEVACAKGVEEAARIATIFLCWQAIHLIKEPKE